MAHVLPSSVASTEHALESVSLIVPVYNEADHLARFLELIDELELPVAKELVFIDDCSTDDSAKIIKEFPFRSKYTFIQQPENRGKGAAIARGITAASGDIIGVQDADFEYDPNDIPRLLEPIVEGRADVTFGSRFRGTQQVHRTFHYLVNRFLTVLSNLMSGLYLSDMETCYKFFRADVIKNIRLDSNRFGFEPEITAKIARLKLRVVELPISYFPRNYIEGKKITWRDGIAAIFHLVHFNLVQRGFAAYSNELPPHYIPKDRNLL